MKILVKNDDGIDSPGIRALAEAMSRVGEVLIVAPDQEQSGVGTAISFHNGLAAAKRDTAIEGGRAYAVSGTPSDCVILGLGPLADGTIDLVVSGINAGCNVGNGVLGSGTTMATRVAHAGGARIPSIAISLSLHGVAGQRRIPQPANQHFRSAPSDDAGVVGKSGAGGHRVGVLLDESASCRYGCLRLPCAPGGPPSYHFAWWDAPQEATWRSRTPGGRYGRLIPRFGPLRCTPCGP